MFLLIKSSLIWGSETENWTVVQGIYVFHSLLFWFDGIYFAIIKTTLFISIDF